MTDPVQYTRGDLVEEVKSLHYGLGLLNERLCALESQSQDGGPLGPDTSKGPLATAASPEETPADPSEELEDLRKELSGARKVTANWKRIVDERTRERDEALANVEDLELLVESYAEGPCERCVGTEAVSESGDTGSG